MTAGPVARQRLVIGIDVGGTKIAGGLIEPETGEIVVRRTLPTMASRGGAAVLDDAVAMATELRAIADRDGAAISGIGVGVAELVDPDGVVQSGDVVGWQGLPVSGQFAAIAPVRVESDVRAGALAEARLGAGEFRLFWEIMLPLVRPALVVVAVFSLLYTWHDFFGPLIYLQDRDSFPLSLGLYAFRAQRTAEWALSMMGSLLTTLPLIIVFLFTQRYFLQGVVMSGIKG